MNTCQSMYVLEYKLSNIDIVFFKVYVMIVNLDDLKSVQTVYVEHVHRYQVI